MMGFPRQPFGFLVAFWIGVERGFNGVGFEVDKYARKIHCPVLLQYGVKDQLVTRREIDAIYKAIPSPDKKLALYEDTFHESLLQKDPVHWKKEVDEFLEGKR